MNQYAVSGEKTIIKYRGKEKEINIPPVPIYSDEKIETFLRDKLKMLSEGTPPPANPENSWLCRYCSFNDLCKYKIASAGAKVSKII